MFSSKSGDAIPTDFSKATECRTPSFLECGVPQFQRNYVRPVTHIADPAHTTFITESILASCVEL